MFFVFNHTFPHFSNITFDFYPSFIFDKNVYILYQPFVKFVCSVKLIVLKFCPRVRNEAIVYIVSRPSWNSKIYWFRGVPFKNWVKSVEKVKNGKTDLFLIEISLPVNLIMGHEAITKIPCINIWDKRLISQNTSGLKKIAVSGIISFNWPSIWQSQVWKSVLTSCRTI